MKTVNKVTIQLTIESGKRTQLKVYGYCRGNDENQIYLKKIDKNISIRLLVKCVLHNVFQMLKSKED